MTVTFDTELAIEAPPERVFSTMVGLVDADKWMKGFVGIERLTPGPPRVGSQFKETRKMMGRSATETFELTEYDPPRRFTLYVDGKKGTSGKGEFRFTYEVLPNGAGTRMRCHAEVTMPGAIANILGKLFKGLLKKVCDKDLFALKEWLEKEKSVA